jgi:hypothetical protein
MAHFPLCITAYAKNGDAVAISRAGSSGTGRDEALQRYELVAMPVDGDFAIVLPYRLPDMAVNGYNPAVWFGGFQHKGISGETRRRREARLIRCLGDDRFFSGGNRFTSRRRGCD